MALGPKEMGAAILKNLEAKTGKRLDEWLEIVTASGLEEKNRIVALLKQEHGIGHFQAQKIYERYRSADEYEAPDRFVGQIFTSPSAAKSYSELRQFILSLGDDVSERPCKTYVPYYRGKQFALVTLKKNTIMIGLALSSDAQVHFSILEPAGSLGSRRINLKLSYPAGIALSDQAKQVLRIAYNENA